MKNLALCLPALFSAVQGTAIDVSCTDAKAGAQLIATTVTSATLQNCAFTNNNVLLNIVDRADSDGTLTLMLKDNTFDGTSTLIISSSGGNMNEVTVEVTGQNFNHISTSNAAVKAFVIEASQSMKKVQVSLTDSKVEVTSTGAPALAAALVVGSRMESVSLSLLGTTTVTATSNTPLAVAAGVIPWFNVPVASGVAETPWTFSEPMPLEILDLSITSASTTSVKAVSIENTDELSSNDNKLGNLQQLSVACGVGSNVKALKGLTKGTEEALMSTFPTVQIAMINSTLTIAGAVNATAKSNKMYAGVAAAAGGIALGCGQHTKCEYESTGGVIKAMGNANIFAAVLGNYEAGSAAAAAGVAVAAGEWGTASITSVSDEFHVESNALVVSQSVGGGCGGSAAASAGLSAGGNYYSVVSLKQGSVDVKSGAVVTSFASTGRGTGNSAAAGGVAVASGYEGIGAISTVDTLRITGDGATVKATSEAVPTWKNQWVAAGDKESHEGGQSAAAMGVALGSGRRTSRQSYVTASHLDITLNGDKVDALVSAGSYSGNSAAAAGIAVAAGHDSSCKATASSFTVTTSGAATVKADGFGNYEAGTSCAAGGIAVSAGENDDDTLSEGTATVEGAAITFNFKDTTSLHANSTTMGCGGGAATAGGISSGGNQLSEISVNNVHLTTASGTSLHSVAQCGRGTGCGASSLGVASAAGYHARHGTVTVEDVWITSAGTLNSTSYAVATAKNNAGTAADDKGKYAHEGAQSATSAGVSSTCGRYCAGKANVVARNFTISVTGGEVRALASGGLYSGDASSAAGIAAAGAHDASSNIAATKVKVTAAGKLYSDVFGNYEAGSAAATVGLAASAGENGDGLDGTERGAAVITADLVELIVQPSAELWANSTGGGCGGSAATAGGISAGANHWGEAVVTQCSFTGGSSSKVVSYASTGRGTGVSSSALGVATAAGYNSTAAFVTVRDLTITSSGDVNATSKAMTTWKNTGGNQGASSAAAVGVSMASGYLMQSTSWGTVGSTKLDVQSGNVVAETLGGTDSSNAAAAAGVIAAGDRNVNLAADDVAITVANSAKVGSTVNGDVAVAGAAAAAVGVAARNRVRLMQTDVSLTQDGEATSAVTGSSVAATSVAKALKTSSSTNECSSGNTDATLSGSGTSTSSGDVGACASSSSSSSSSSDDDDKVHWGWLLGLGLLLCSSCVALIAAIAMLVKGKQSNSNTASRATEYQEMNKYSGQNTTYQPQPVQTAVHTVQDDAVDL